MAKSREGHRPRRSRGREREPGEIDPITITRDVQERIERDTNPLPQRREAVTRRTAEPTDVSDSGRVVDTPRVRRLLEDPQLRPYIEKINNAYFGFADQLRESGVDPQEVQGWNTAYQTWDETIQKMNRYKSETNPDRKAALFTEIRHDTNLRRWNSLAKRLNHSLSTKPEAAPAPASAETDDADALRRQVAELQAQVARLEGPQSVSTPVESDISKRRRADLTAAVARMVPFESAALSGGVTPGPPPEPRMNREAQDVYGGGVPLPQMQSRTEMQKMLDAEIGEMDAISHGSEAEDKYGAPHVEVTTSAPTIDSRDAQAAARQQQELEEAMTSGGAPPMGEMVAGAVAKAREDARRAAEVTGG